MTDDGISDSKRMHLFCTRDILVRDIEIGITKQGHFVSGSLSRRKRDILVGDIENEKTEKVIWFQALIAKGKAHFCKGP